MIGPLIIITVGLASARITTLLVHDTLLEPVRHRLYLRWPPRDDPRLGFEYQRMWRSGEYVPAGATRPWSMFGELLSCTRCVSVWVTAAVWTAAAIAGAIKAPPIEQTLGGVAAMWVAAWGAGKI